MTLRSRLERLVPALGRRTRAARWRRAGARPKVWAHRGSSGRFTENTLAAFEAARGDGADGVEFDVHPCKSGEIIVFHDHDLARLAGRPERVRDMTWDELRGLELPGGHKIPRLEEALEATEGLELDVEIKSPAFGRAGAHLPHEVARILAEQGAVDRTLVSCFDPVPLVQLHARLPEVALAFLFHAGEPWPVRRAIGAGALVGASALHPENVLCTAERVAAWHEDGYAINAWTVDDHDELLRLAEIGVDGVFTNEPAAAAALYRSLTGAAATSPRS
jgi:glycerophosphoryl diester phosphodiesterase